MIAIFDREKLHDMLVSFHNLTGINTAVYNNQFTRILSYPEEDIDFCALLNKSKIGCSRCIISTENLCKRCLHENNVIIEKCHIGLTEIISPITDDETVYGYLVLGQVTNEIDKEKLYREIAHNTKEYQLDEAELRVAVDNVLYYTDSQLKDAAKILKALADGIIFNKLIYYKESPVAIKIAKYIRENLAENLSVKSLCEAFHISNSELYRITKGVMPNGVAAFVREERIKKAAELLRTTNKPSWQIAAETGFSDVNYFLRTFKAVQGIPAGKYRAKL